MNQIVKDRAEVQVHEDTPASFSFGEARGWPQALTGAVEATK